MTKFKYTQADWKSSFLFVGVPFLFYRILQNYIGVVTAMLVGFGIGIILFFLLGRYFISVVEFKETYLLLKNGAFRKDIKVSYSEINRRSFSYDRLLNFYIYTADNTIKLPPPTKLDKAEELFQWLGTKNPAIKMEITK